MRTRSIAAAIPTAGAVLLLGACGGDDFTGTEIRMLDNVFAAEVVAVEPGEQIRFVNAGRVPHHAIENDGRFDTLAAAGTNQDPGESWTISIDEPGVYDYVCSLHATQDAEGSWEGMTGTLVVGDAANAAASHFVLSQRYFPPAFAGGLSKNPTG